jgi:hypothetical protein
MIVWENDIKKDLKEIRSEDGLDSSGSLCGTQAGSYKHGNKPSGSIKDEELLTISATIRLPRRILLHGVGEMFHIH